MVAPSESAILACVQFFETLTKDSVEDIRTLASPRMRYRDPLTDAQGIDAVVAYLHKWFRDLDDRGFLRGDRAQCCNVLVSHWTMQFRVRKSRAGNGLEGMSRTPSTTMARWLTTLITGTPRRCSKPFPSWAAPSR